MLDNIGAGIGGRDDLDLGGEPRVAAAVVGMMVRAENVLDRLAGDALHLRHDPIVILLELIVDQDHSFARDIDRDVAAVAFNHVRDLP